MMRRHDRTATLRRGRHVAIAVGLRVLTRRRIERPALGIDTVAERATGDGTHGAADRMRVKGVGEDYAELLEAAGVDTVKELKYRNPANLAKAMAEANAKRKLVRLMPSEKAVVRWIEHAKKLPLKISY